MPVHQRLFNACPDFNRGSRIGKELLQIEMLFFQLYYKQKNSDALASEFFFVPRTGFEPARSCEHQPLKLACLPIPPPGYFGLERKDIFTTHKMKTILTNKFRVQNYYPGL